MCCKRKVLHGALVGSSPLMINLANNVGDMLIGSRILTPPKAISKMRVFQATSTQALY